MTEAQVQPAASPIKPPADVLVTRVQSSGEKKEFIAIQYDLNKGYPAFVPPLLMERNDFLNPKKNPFFEHGTVELFIARRAGKAVGRIAAIVDNLYNDTHKVKYGWFGMFECVNDAGVAAALFAAAEDWLKARGMAEVVGPASFSSNGEFGLLIDAHEVPPKILMPWNPPTYQALIENSGYVKAKDLWAWHIDITTPIPEKVERIAEKVRKREGLVVRPANLKDWDNEIRKIKEVYNDAWENNWGFVPMTDREIDQMAKELKQIVIPELALFAEVEGKVVAFALSLPDANIALKATGNGQLTTFGLPIGLVKMLLALKSKINSGRLAVMGVKAGYRKRGIDSVLMLDTFYNSRKQGWPGGEISWTLEDNDMVNRAIEVFGCKKYKTYRLFKKQLGAPEMKS
jgi:GNAT superfamily N-acetyltransferase